jgi:hypothetical protein
MLRAQKRLSRGMNSTITHMPSTTGGWNVRDPLPAMGQNDAVILDNFFPLASDVMLRYGYAQHVTGIAGTVNTVIAYNSPTANKLFAAAGDSIYDVTSAGAVGAASVTGLTSDKWQTVNVTTAGGSFIMLANGADSMRLYDGSAWSVSTITGVTTANIISLNVFKSRVWLIEKSSLKAWYLPTNAVTGAAAQWDLSSIFKRGGFLMAMGTWSLDAGQGLDDYCVFVTSQGELAVYKGTDPTSATTFSLVGVFDIGAPIGRRCLVKYAGDLLMISRDGLIPISTSLPTSRVNNKVALTDKIQQAVSDATTQYGSTFGWQTLLYPAENMLLLNVPINATISHQYVMNTLTGSWCRFTGWDATCWERFNELIYFGTSGGVNVAWSGQSDNNSNINGEVLQAFSYFGSSSSTKNIGLVRPILSTNGTPGISIGINVDFDISAPTSIPTFSALTTALWDVSLWDVGIWGGDFSIKKDWLTVSGIGKCAALHMTLALKGISLKWEATDFCFETGDYL